MVGFILSPHKVSVCVLLQMYAPPAQSSVPFPFSSVSNHNRLGLFLLSLIKSRDGVFEPRLEELIAQLKEIGGHLNDWFCENLTRRLLSFSSPDDLFNFFSDMLDFLGGTESSVDDDQIILDPNCELGLFLRRCILEFNKLSFEGVCHLITTITTYCKDALSECELYESPRLQDSRMDQDLSSGYENMDLEKFSFGEVTAEIEERKKSNERGLFHSHAPKALGGCLEDRSDLKPFKVSSDLKVKHNHKHTEDPLDAISKCMGSSGYHLRTTLQIQGYLREQADAIEKNGRSFPLEEFESILTQLQKLAPELHRVHFLRYLNSLYNDDYPSALENLHRYFDYSAGTEGLDVPLLSGTDLGKYEIALLFLGMMHFHFGHPRQSLEVLTEAVRVCQHHGDDTCLAYTLAAICNLLAEFGISDTSGILGSSYSPVINLGSHLAVQQKLLVLLRQSINRAGNLKLTRLVACNHTAMAKFELMHVQRPLLSFGPKYSLKCKTCPINVCKELRQTHHLMSDFSGENSGMINDVSSSTYWLKKYRKPFDSLISTQENESEMKLDAFNFSIPQDSLPKSVLQVVGSSYLVRATAWEIYGSAPLARINALVHTTCFADSSSTADAASAYAKLVQHLSIFKGYKEALAALRIAEEKFLSVSKSRILLLKLQLLHEQALHRGHLKLAQQLCDELGVLASSVNGVDMELKVEARIRYSRTLLAANQFGQAASTAHSLFCMCYKFNMQVENARVLLLLAEIHKRSGRAVLGIPYALASLTFSQSLNLDLLKVSAKLTLAELLLLLGPNHSKRASNIIHSALPVILGHGGLELRSRAFIAESKCYLSDPGFSVIDDPEMVLDPLRQAAEELEFLEYHELAAEAYYLMANIYDKLKLFEAREEAASSFRNHIMALQTDHKQSI
ncbi:anaphase-promoting complex subunit 5 [Impatiens glandulifera]|uniref:anaphase-promoting complex subunit 5 n=1 Tax=Impatiens glandulifera TaxID=253017 RepID=UPI001FB14A4F|nr:anaphase-promoting complex subunit 5 [Impatiens glandulifera]